MTANRALKRRVRSRAARTGESYTAALRHFTATPGAEVPDTCQNPPVQLRLAVAQTTHRQHPSDPAGFRAAGLEVQSLMHQARAEGAELIQLPEATLCFPSKRALSSEPGQMAEADWDKFAWDAMQSQLSDIKRTAGQLGLWTVIGAQHRPCRPRASGEVSPARPRNSLYVIGPDGQIRTRYDERLLSRTKQTYLYEPGDAAVTFEVNGLRFGVTSGLEVLFPDLFSDYEAQGVDCVLFSTAGPPDPAEADSLASSARTHALQNGIWVGYATPADKAPFAASGVIGPSGSWTVRCPDRAEPALAIAELTRRPTGPGRDWRRAMLTAHRDRPERVPAP